MRAESQAPSLRRRALATPCNAAIPCRLNGATRLQTLGPPKPRPTNEEGHHPTMLLALAPHLAWRVPLRLSLPAPTIARWYRHWRANPRHRPSLERPAAVGRVCLQ